MRLFVSYARIDKPYCIQIVNQLGVHDVWFDKRLYAGQQWWKEILRRLNWCEGFVYLLSPDSVASEYCLRELEIARKLNRVIIPVLIQPNTNIPASINEMQYVDLTGGLTAESVGELLNSIYMAEQQHRTPKNNQRGEIKTVKPPAPSVNSDRVVSLAVQALEEGEYDRTIFLLKQAKVSGYTSRFVDIDHLLYQAERALEQQTDEKEKQREYALIVELFRHKQTRSYACEVFEEFRAVYPNYDPENIAQVCYAKNRQTAKQSVNGKHKPFIPNLTLITIPAGIVRIDGTGDHDYDNHKGSREIGEFEISKYPITNEQYQIFLNAEDGYCDPSWWRYSPQALQWRRREKITPPKFKGPQRPREKVCWYDAVAFCNWLSYKTNTTISLPNVVHWQRAVQGNDDRIFPWGNEFDTSRCNTRESNLRKTTRVDQYDGCSPYGVCDLAGNIWEWCMETAIGEEIMNGHPVTKRAVVGGSFVSPLERAQVNFRYYLHPETVYSSIGFRIIRLKEPQGNE